MKADELARPINISGLGAQAVMFIPNAAVLVDPAVWAVLLRQVRGI